MTRVATDVESDLKRHGFSCAERKSFSINPNDYKTHIELLILYAELGRKDKAFTEAEKILKISPNFSVKAYVERASYNDSAQAERDMAVLRKAGLKYAAASHIYYPKHPF